MTHDVADSVMFLYVCLSVGVGTGGATGAMAPHFWPTFVLKSFPIFFNTILKRKTIHRDEESTNLRGNVS